MRWFAAFGHFLADFDHFFKIRKCHSFQLGMNNGFVDFDFEGSSATNVSGDLRTRNFSLKKKTTIILIANNQTNFRNLDPSGIGVLVPVDFSVRPNQAFNGSAEPKLWPNLSKKGSAESGTIFDKNRGFPLHFLLPCRKHT